MLALAGQAGLPDDRAGEVVLAVHELAANVICHGGGKGRLRVWRRAGHLAGALHCQVDDGDLIASADPVASLDPFPERPGHGLWVARRVADQMQALSGPRGTRVTLVFRVARRAVSSRAAVSCGSAALPGASRLAQAGQYLAGVELENTGVLGADLTDVHLVESGVGVGADRLDVVVGRRAARSGDHVFGHQLGQLGEVPGQRQQLSRFAGDGLVSAEPVHGLPGLPDIRPPSKLEAALDGPVAPAGIAVEPDEVGVRLDAYIAVGHAAASLMAFSPNPDMKMGGGEKSGTEYSRAVSTR